MHVGAILAEVASHGNGAVSSRGLIRRRSLLALGRLLFGFWDRWEAGREDAGCLEDRDGLLTDRLAASHFVNVREAEPVALADLARVQVGEDEAVARVEHPAVDKPL